MRGITSNTIRFNVSNCKLEFRKKFTSNNKNTFISKSLEYSQYGDPSSVLSLNEREVKREKGEVLVKMLSAPINPADVNMIQGVYGIKPSSFPAIGGNEGVGIVIETSESDNDNNKNNLKEGDYVIPSLPSFGTWRSYLACNPNDLTKIPNNISPQSASVLSVNPSTAYRLLHDSSLLPGEAIVQNGSNSMVGQSVIQLANVMGIKTINIIRNREEGELKRLKEKLYEMGGNEVLTEEEFSNYEKKKDLNNKYPRVSLAFNCTGGKSATDLARFLSEGGTMITYGGMSKQPVTIPTSLLIFKNIHIRGFWLSQWLQDHPNERLQMLEELARLVKENKLTFDLEEYSLSDYQLALSRFSQEKKR